MPLLIFTWKNKSAAKESNTFFTNETSFPLAIAGAASSFFTSMKDFPISVSATNISSFFTSEEVSFPISLSAVPAAQGGGSQSQAIVGNVSTINSIVDIPAKGSPSVTVIDGQPYLYYSRSSTTGLRRKNLFLGSVENVRLSVNGGAYNTFGSTSFKTASHPLAPMGYVVSSGLYAISLNSSTDHAATLVGRGAAGFSASVGLISTLCMAVSTDGTALYGVYNTCLYRISLNPSTGQFINNAVAENFVSGTNYFKAVCALSDGNIAVLKIEGSSSAGALKIQIFNSNLQLLQDYTPLPGSTWVAGATYHIISPNSQEIYFGTETHLYQYSLGGNTAIALAGQSPAGTIIDGTGGAARFRSPAKLFYYNNELYMVDYDSLRKIT